MTLIGWDQRPVIRRIVGWAAHQGRASTPARYGNTEIMKAVKLAATIGVKYVITTELDPETEWGKSLSYDQQVLVVAEKLYEPVRLAGDLGIRVLLESHGPLTGSIQGLKDIMAALGNPAALGINLDTGNSWLGGADPVAMATEFKSLIGLRVSKPAPSRLSARKT